MMMKPRGPRRSSSHLPIVLVSLAALVLFLLAIGTQLPRHTLLLQDEITSILYHRGSSCDCHHGWVEGAPLFCRLGLPANDSSTVAAAAAAAAVSGNSSDSSSGNSTQQQKQQQHKLAVLIPYRDRLQHLTALLAALRPFLDRQGRAHDVFVVEQVDGWLFNRGALLNAAALLLGGSEYDYFLFQDVDTVPLDKGNIQIAYPEGDAPLHLTPHWLHPKSNYEDFFGGLLAITPQQLRRANGFGTQYWGWGREDDNLAKRLQRVPGMWPPQQPDVPRGLLAKRSYFRHQSHPQATELRGIEATGTGGGSSSDGGGGGGGAAGRMRFFQEDPRLPYRGAKIMSSQPELLLDFTTGLNTTMFAVAAIQPMAGGLNATRLALRLHCDVAATPWCDPAALTSRGAAGGSVKHAAAVAAVVGS